MPGNLSVNRKSAHAPRALKRSNGRRSADTKKRFPAAAILQAILPAAFALVGLVVGLTIDESLQRTEVSVASKNVAYNEMIRAGDEALTPSFLQWELGANMAADGPVDPALELSIARQLSASRTQEDVEKRNALRDAANQLRLVVEEEDVELINNFVASLEEGRPPGGAEGGAWPTTGQRLAAYSNAKLDLVNEFRADVLGEGELPADEADRMLVLDRGIIDAQKELIESLERLSEGLSPPAVPAP